MCRWRAHTVRAVALAHAWARSESRALQLSYAAMDDDKAEADAGASPGGYGATD